MPALPSWLADPLWDQFAALLPPREVFVPTHPWGCHRRRIGDRIVFDKLVQVLRFGCSYDAIADSTCSATTLRARRDEWIALLESVGVPCGPINDIGDVFANEQVVAREVAIELPHPTAGKVKLVRNPIRMSATPATSDKAPPLLGQHTDEVLADVLVLDEGEIAALRGKGVV